jgi:alpha-mannosidase
MVAGGVDGTAAGLAVVVDGLSAGDVVAPAGADIGLTAARSPLFAWHDPAPAAAAADPRYLDVGEHRFRVRIVPFRPDPAVPVPPEVTSAAADLLCPVEVVREGAHAGRAPAAASFACVRSGSARLAVLKQAEDGDGVVLRIAETSGAATTAHIRLGAGLAPADLRVELGPHQVRTLRLPPARGAELPADLPTEPVEPVEVDLCEWAPGQRPPVQPRPPVRRAAP